MSAFGGKADMTVCRCLLSRSLLGLKRTWPNAPDMSASDPKRTLAAHSNCCRTLIRCSPEVGAAMRRREFITLLGGAAAVWPCGAAAQQLTRSRRLAVLTGFRENDPESQRRIGALVSELQSLGWVNGGSVNID